MRRESPQFIEKRPLVAYGEPESSDGDLPGPEARAPIAMNILCPYAEAQAGPAFADWARRVAATAR